MAKAKKGYETGKNLWKQTIKNGPNPEEPHPDIVHRQAVDIVWQVQDTGQKTELKGEQRRSNLLLTNSLMFTKYPYTHSTNIFDNNTNSNK